MAQMHALALTREELEELARRVTWLRKRRGWTQRELAKRCTELREQLFPTAHLPFVPHIRRDRIAKIELMAHNGHAGSVARLVLEHELRLLAGALGVDPCWLRGGNQARRTFFWDAWDPEPNPEQLRAVIAYHDERSTVRWAFSEPFPCTLMPPEFSEQYFALWVAAAREHPPAAASVQQVTANMNAVAAGNRQRSLERLTEGSLQFFITMPRKTITAIALGSGLYSAVAPNVRAECLEWVLELVQRFPDHLKLAFATAADLAPFRSWTSSYQSHYVSGGLSNWADRSGNKYFSEDAAVVQRHLALLQAMYQAASVRETGEVIEILQHGLRQLRSGRTATARLGKPRHRSTPRRSSQARRQRAAAR